MSSRNAATVALRAGYWLSVGVAALSALLLAYMVLLNLTNPGEGTPRIIALATVPWVIGSVLLALLLRLAARRSGG